MKIKAYFIAQQVFSNTKEAYDLLAKSQFGEKKENKIIYSFSEAFFLVENKKMEIYDAKEKIIDEKTLLKRFTKIDRKFNYKYLVFKDLRKKGYIVKTALKFGAEFRVYKKGEKAGKHHSKWVLFPVLSTETLKWHDFTAKNRVAHSTKKILLIAIIDEEENISYYEVKWLKP